MSTKPFKLHRHDYENIDGKMVRVQRDEIYIWAAVNTETGEVDLEDVQQYNDDLRMLDKGWEWKRFTMITTPSPTPAPNETISEAAKQAAHPEDKCGKCGGLNPVWFAPNNIWDRVTDSASGILCPNCFTESAADAGIDPVWMLVPEGSQSDSATADLRTENKALRERLKSAEKRAASGLTPLGIATGEALAEIVSETAAQRDALQRTVEERDREIEACKIAWKADLRTTVQLSSDLATARRELEEAKAGVEAYATAARVISLHLKDHCDESLSHHEMISEAARRARNAIESAKESEARSVDFCIALTGRNPDDIKAAFVDLDTARAQFAQAEAEGRIATEQFDELKLELEGACSKLNALKTALESLRPCAHGCSDGNCPHDRRFKALAL